MSQRTERWDEGACVIEGPDLIDAAFAADVDVEALYVDVDASQHPDVLRLTTLAHQRGVRTFALATGVLARVADATTPQPVLASVHFTTCDITTVVPDRLVLVLDNVRDPGNLGTIIRSADAAGVATIILTGDCVDPYNPKTLRASAGSIFHVDVVRASFDETATHLREGGVPLLATVLSNAPSYIDYDLAGPCAVVIGNESAGLADEAIARCDGRITIEMVGRAESLNAGVAAALIAFEALRQRRATTDA